MNPLTLNSYVTSHHAPVTYMIYLANQDDLAAGRRGDAKLGKHFSEDFCDSF